MLCVESSAIGFAIRNLKYSSRYLLPLHSNLNHFRIFVILSDKCYFTINGRCLPNTLGCLVTRPSACQPPLEFRWHKSKKVKINTTGSPVPYTYTSMKLFGWPHWFLDGIGLPHMSGSHIGEDNKERLQIKENRNKREVFFCIIEFHSSSTKRPL